MRVHLKSVLYVTVLCASLVVCFRFILSPRPLRSLMQLSGDGYGNSGRRIRKAVGIAIGGRGFKYQNIAGKLRNESFRRRNPRLEKFVKNHEAYINQRNRDPPAQMKEIKLWDDQRNPNNPVTESYKFKLRKGQLVKKSGFNEGLLGRGRRSLHSFENGSAIPEKGQMMSQSRDVYPSEENYEDDRILAQLNFVPEAVRKAREEGKEVKMKKIQLMHSVHSWGVKEGNQTFRESQCEVQYCEFMDTKSMDGFKVADLVVFETLTFAHRVVSRSPNQVWLVYLLENPYVTLKNTAVQRYGTAIFNWTASYRHDSTLVTPYEKFVPFDPSVKSLPLTRNYAKGKKKKIAWFVSNCRAANNRLEYAKELGKYMTVDIYGACGELRCNPANPRACFDMLSYDYKFYLSFENANCRDYITEKFFVNGLQNDVIPIVMGAAPEDYRRAAPPHSFIHVDDFDSAKSLADYLIELDHNDDLYNDYFRWKGTGSFIDTKFWCRVCALAHDVEARGSSWYDNSKVWWDNRLENVCIDQRSWRNATRGKTIGDLPIVDRSGQARDSQRLKVF